MSHRAVAAQAFPDSVARLVATLADARVDPAVLRSLGVLDWATILPSAAAPGFVYLAGAVGGTAVGGGGRDLAEAAGRLAGEASEVAAQRKPPPARCDLPVAPALRAIWGDGPAMPALDLVRGGATGAPMAAVFPAVAAAPGAPPRSLGLAAGRDRDAARLAGLLELIERDAAAAWWTGAVRPRAVDLAGAARVAADVGAMRADPPHRATALLALPSSTGLPVVCALSRDAAGGGLAFGLKAALDLPRAIAGATIELLQMEIALEIARLRAAQGRATPYDAIPLGHAALDPDAHPAFAPLPPLAATMPAIADLDALVAHLSALGLAVVVADLEGPEGGLAVAKAFVVGLRPMPGPGPAPRPDAPGAQTALM